MTKVKIGNGSITLVDVRLECFNLIKLVWTAKLDVLIVKTQKFVKNAIKISTTFFKITLVSVKNIFGKLLKVYAFNALKVVLTASLMKSVKIVLMIL